MKVEQNWQVSDTLVQWSAGRGSALTIYRGRKMSIIFCDCPRCSSHAKSSMTLPSRSSGNKIWKSGLIHLLHPSCRLLLALLLEQNRQLAGRREWRVGSGPGRFVHIKNLIDGFLNTVRNEWRLTGGTG